jgi:cell division protein FtsW
MSIVDTIRPWAAPLPRQLSLSLNWPLLITTLVLLSIGLIMVASASIDFAATNYNDPWFFVRRHLLYLAISAGAAAIILFIPTIFWRKYGWLLFFVALFFLVLVFKALRL